MATDLMAEVVEPEPPVRRSRRRVVVIVVVVTLVLIGVVWARWPTHGPDVRAGTRLVNEQGLADSYGIDLKLVGLSALGGMIDFRFQVVDPDKADSVVHDVNTFPKFVVEDTGETISVATLPHSHSRTLNLGGSYFFLIPNAHNAVHVGDEVTMVIGDVRLEHVVVQG